MYYYILGRSTMTNGSAIHVRLCCLCSYLRLRTLHYLSYAIYAICVRSVRTRRYTRCLADGRFKLRKHLVPYTLGRGDKVNKRLKRMYHQKAI